MIAVCLLYHKWGRLMRQFASLQEQRMKTENMGGTSELSLDGMSIDCGPQQAYTMPK